jgi:site-specific DNA recombinase
VKSNRQIPMTGKINILSNHIPSPGRARTAPMPAVIYCRVSSGKQIAVGDGLNSQETRCREFASRKGYDVVQVFHEKAVSGKVTKSPAMHELLAFLRQQRKQGPHIVIIDDISRLARQLLAHIELRQAIAKASGMLVSPNMVFGDDSDSQLGENIMASVAQHAREKNTEQARNRMRARLQNGYWVFQAPIGYRYQAVPQRGKMLVKDEPYASIIQEVLEGYAAGRFQTPTEVQRHLHSIASFQRKRRAHLQFVLNTLNRPVYAGYVETPNWGIERRKGHHLPLISFETYLRIQERLQEKAKAPARKDLHRDFPLRGFVTCDYCRRSITASWSKGRSARYAYYPCCTKGCPERGKSIAKKKIEAEFEAILCGLQPTEETLNVTLSMLRSEWNNRERKAAEQRKFINSEITELDGRIEQIMEHICNTASQDMVVLYEKEIAKLNDRKLLLVEKSSKRGSQPADFDAIVRTVRGFLASPCNLWRSRDIEHQRLVLRLTFATKIAYSRSEGFRTAETTLPFKTLDSVAANKNTMVGAAGLEPATRRL